MTCVDGSLYLILRRIQLQLLQLLQLLLQLLKLRLLRLQPLQLLLLLTTVVGRKTKLLFFAPERNSGRFRFVGPAGLPTTLLS